ncbi:MAG: RNA polymerase sigma factor [Opitutales bacterium]
MTEAAMPEFSQVVEQYYENLYRFGHSLAKNEHEAGDLVQQTFLIYAEKGSAIRDAGKIKSWLFTTLYREFLRVRRRGASMASYEPELLEAEAPPVSPDVVTTTDSHSAVSALEQVDEAYRAPLTLFYLQDLSYKEIAATLDIPIGTVMSRLSRGKAQLKKILTAEKEAASQDS